MPGVLDLDLVIHDRSRELPDPSGVVDHVQLTGGHEPRLIGGLSGESQACRDFARRSVDEHVGASNGVELLVTHGHDAV